MTLRNQLRVRLKYLLSILFLPGSIAANDSLIYGVNYHPNIAFLVPPLLYQKWFLQVLLLLFATSFIFLYARRRIKTIKLKNEELANAILSHNKELEEALKALKKSEGQLRRHSNMQDRLIAVMAHDIKNPLKYTVMAAQHVFQNIEKEDRASMIRNTRMLYNSTQKIYLLTENLLEYIKLHSKDGKIAFEMVNLHDIIENKIELFRDIALSQSTSIKNDIPQQFFVNSNAELLGIIVHNLVDNAIKVTYKGEIKIASSLIPQGFELTIEDTGPGMSQQIIEYLSEPQNFDKSPAGYTGIGTSIVKELMSWINGQLYAGNKEIGAVVKLTFRN
jgi:signal transduction histidine kinase